MPNNYPYERWYWNDWFASTAILTIQTKGVWHELLGRMFLDDRSYFVVGTEDELARLVGCSIDQIRASISELQRRKIADVTLCYENVTGLLRIECRRLKKEYLERKRASEGMRKLREDRRGYGDVTDTRARNQYPVTSILKENNKEKSDDESPDAPEKPDSDLFGETPKPLDEYPFEEFWEEYGYKVGRGTSEKLYSKIKNEDRVKIRERVKLYVAATPDKKYRKHPETWLRNRCWEDEIVSGASNSGMVMHEIAFDENERGTGPNEWEKN